MEIQDKNSILQQMLGARLFNVSAAQPSENVFADMLSSGKAEKTVSFEEAKNNIGVSVKDKKETEKPEVSAKENKKEKIQSKKDNADNKPEEKIKDKPSAEISEDDAVAAVPAQNGEESVSSLQQGEDAAPAEEGTVEVVAADAPDAGEPVLANVMAEVPVLAQAGAETTPVINAGIPSDVDSALADSVEILPVAEDVARPVSEENTAGQQVVDGEDTLLLRQAEYIDKKVGSDSKRKIAFALHLYRRFGSLV